MNTATTVGSINFLKNPIYACLKSIFKKQAIFLINNFQNLFHLWLNLQQQQKIRGDGICIKCHGISFCGLSETERYSVFQFFCGCML